MKQLLAIASLIILMSACTEEKFEKPAVPSEDGEGIEITGVTCTSDDFVLADKVGTRTLAGVSDWNDVEAAISQWEESKDTIGIFPVSGSAAAPTGFTGDQMGFLIVPSSIGEDSGASATAIATVDGGGWALKNSSTYYAYYPFNRKNYHLEAGTSKIPYSYAGQTAVVADADNNVNIGAFDYMYSAGESPESGMVTFNFTHLGALAKFTMTFPVDATYKTLTITASEAVFPVDGTFDLFAEEVKLTSAESATSISVSLDGLGEVTAGATKDIYFMLPPADCSSLSSLTAILLDSGDNKYVVDIQTKNIEAGMAYEWAVAPAIDLSANGTANCYIVSKAGRYKFKASHKGNSTATGDKLDGITTASVLWESYGTSKTIEEGDLIKDVTYNESDEYIYFTATANAVASSDAIDKEGNAVIAAKGASGTIWSWHIWMTDEPEDQFYDNNAGTIMDRNLGATSATPGSVKALGLFYQYGRKDPFLGSSSILSGTRAASTIEWSTTTTATIENATKNPTSFITRDGTHNGDFDWNTSKSIYDPCPPGYRVFDTPAKLGGWNSTNKGRTGGSSVWYPAAGVLHYSDGGLREVGSTGNYWYCDYNYNLYAYYGTYFSSSDCLIAGTPDQNSYLTSRGLSVRCLKMK